ncbi:hypothetical protein BDV93DRAFT_337247 [Ceratobasidium sp. AG-I]|nr:hypothetical protein BDV93DRAFT_337247 [Ceratobasidium sp. AG-I]
MLPTKIFALVLVLGPARPLSEISAQHTLMSLVNNSIGNARSPRIRLTLLGGMPWWNNWLSGVVLARGGYV